MCMEDHRLARVQSAAQRQLDVGVVSMLAVERNPHRTCLIFNAPSIGSVRLTLTDPAIATAGLIVRTADVPFVLTDTLNGALCIGPWYVIGSAALTMMVFESFLSKE